uniref:Uncharacterized protein n=1 Tax=Strigamia maritima TaxID=126957 RepID=T1JKA0_STRMM
MPFGSPSVCDGARSEGGPSHAHIPTSLPLYHLARLLYFSVIKSNFDVSLSTPEPCGTLDDQTPATDGGPGEKNFFV